MSTDYIYAVLSNNGTVTNAVVADNPDAVDALRILIPDATDIVLVTEETRPAYIGGDMLDGKFRPPSAFPSWVWDKKSWSWTAPVAYPQDGNGYTWDEETTSWIEMPPAPVDPEKETPAP